MSKFDPSLQRKYTATERLLPSREFAGLIEAVLEKGADFRLKAKGKSMSPFICDGDIVTIGRIRRTVKKGDVIAVRQPGSDLLLIHRVIDKQRGKLLIKGDGNWAADGWIAEKKILGEVISVERNAGVVRAAPPWLRRLIVFVSQQRWLQSMRFSIYKLLQCLGEVY